MTTRDDADDRDDRHYGDGADDGDGEGHDEGASPDGAADDGGSEDSAASSEPPRRGPGRPRGSGHLDRGHDKAGGNGVFCTFRGCQRLRTPEELYCQRHLRYLQRTLNERQAANVEITGEVGPLRRSVYTRHAGPELRSVLTSLAQATPDERLDLGDEIDLARSSVIRYLRIVERLDDAQADTSTRMAALANMSEAIELVSRVARKASAIYKESYQTVLVTHLGYVIGQIVAAIDEELAATGVGEAVRERLADRIRGVRLPLKGTDATEEALTAYL